MAGGLEGGGGQEGAAAGRGRRVRGCISCSETRTGCQNGARAVWWGQRISGALRKTSASAPSRALSKTPAFPTSSTFHERARW